MSDTKHILIIYDEGGVDHHVVDVYDDLLQLYDDEHAELVDITIPGSPLIYHGNGKWVPVSRLGETGARSKVEDAGV